MAYQFKDDDVICTCTSINKKQFLNVIDTEKITTLDEAREKTRVNVACGMCVYIVEKLLADKQ